MDRRTMTNPPGRRNATSLRGALFTATVVAAALALPVPGPAAASTGVGPSTSGVIVWTDRTGTGDHLMIARADGTHARSLTPAIPGHSDIDAQVSPDGRWIAYEHDTPDVAELRLVRPDGRDDHAVDVGCVDPCVAVVTPTWLSDERLAFTLVEGPFDTGSAASAVLWTARLDGAGVRRLSEPGIDGTFEDYSAHVSRDRRYLTFRRLSNDGAGSALFRMDAGGARVRQLTPFSLGADVYDLSTASSGPTEDLLVFESFGRGDADKTFVDIATVPATCRSLPECTSKIVWLTDNATTGRRNANPQWSPDGTSIVFTDRASVDVTDAEIWTMRYLGTQRRKISNSPDFDFRPTWGVRAGSRA